MIELIVKGNAGNQFFEYAFARFLIKKRNVDDELIINYYGNYNCITKTNYPRILEGLFCVKSKTINKGLGFRYLYRRIYNKFEIFFFNPINYDRLAKIGFYNYPNDKKCDFISTKNTIILRGNYEFCDYADFVREELLSELIPKKTLSNEVNKIISLMKNKNSICVSIRVWPKEQVSNRRKQMSPELYKKMFAILKEKISAENLVIFISSNNMNWVYENFSINDNNVIYDNEDFDIYDKLAIMTSCKNFILSNSTFSWWVAYLAQYHDKKAVLPFCPDLGIFQRKTVPKGFKPENWIFVNQDNGDILI